MDWLSYVWGWVVTVGSVLNAIVHFVFSVQSLLAAAALAYGWKYLPEGVRAYLRPPLSAIVRWIRRTLAHLIGGGDLFADSPGTSIPRSRTEIRSVAKRRTWSGAMGWTVFGMFLMWNYYNPDVLFKPSIDKLLESKPVPTISQPK